MKNGFKPLRTHPEFIAFFTKFDASSIGGILLCVLTGTVLTVLVQSSSATVGITMALASQGLLNLPGSVALILGDNIGTTITAQLAAIGSNIHARRVAMAHTIFNMSWACSTSWSLFHPFVESCLVDYRCLDGDRRGRGHGGGRKPNIARYIANAHTLFNVINCLVFLLLLLNLLVKASIKLTPGREPDSVALQDLGRPGASGLQVRGQPLGGPGPGPRGDGAHGALGPGHVPRRHRGAVQPQAGEPGPLEAVRGGPGQPATAHHRVFWCR